MILQTQAARGRVHTPLALSVRRRQLRSERCERAAKPAPGWAQASSSLYYEVRYESLISRPEQECQRLCKFLDVPYNDAMIRFAEGKARTELPNARKTPKKAWLPITSGMRNWRKEMPVKDVEGFEAAAGDLLEELGYPRACPHPPEQKLAWAARIRESFARDASALGKRLPKGWQA